MRLFLKFVFGFVLIAAVLYATISDFGMPRIPKKISISYPAVQYEPGDPSSVTKTTIEIEGTYYRRLFQEPLFKGAIRIPDYVYTLEAGTDLEFPLFRRDGVLMLALMYPTYKFNSRGGIEDIKTETLGLLYIDNEFEQIRIVVFPKPENPDRKLYIAAPATNLEEANNILKYGETAE